ncbi:MAG: MotA/TolQ/ExbB proton channel family protein [Bacillota bacterium]
MISEFIEKAGPISYPLLLAAFLTIFLLIERSIIFLINYRKINKEKYLNHISNYISGNSTDDNIINKKQGLAAKIYHSVLKKSPNNRKEFNLLMDSAELDYLPQLERGLGLLNFIGQASPTLGLLGTVTGMIKTFQVLGLGGSPEQMAVGISEALFTTAAGLLISLPAVGGYHFFYGKLEKIITQLENLRIEAEIMLFNGNTEGGKDEV